MRYIFFLLYLGSCPSLAQNLELRGMVTDSQTQHPVAYATIALFQNGVIVDGTSSDEEGNFILKTSEDFDVIEISFIGYATVNLIRDETDNLLSIQVALIPSAMQMEEVTVILERTVTEHKIDRRIVNLGKDLQQAGTTALEAFDQIPEIQTDLSTGTIALRGGQNIRLLVNGKPSGLNAGELLEQIPSTAIAQVEIITAPSASEQADGISGIVNIVLKKDTLRGLNLNLNSGYGTYRYQYGTNGNWSKEWLNMRFSWNSDHQDRTSFQTLDRVYASGDTESIFTPHVFNGDVQRAALGLDLFISEHDEFSLDWDYTDNFYSFFNPSSYTNVTGQADFEYLRTSSNFNYTNTFNANYQHRFSDKDHFAEVDFNLNRNDNTFPIMDFREGAFQLEEKFDYENTLRFLGVDYSVPLGIGNNLETGFAWNSRDLASDYFFRDANTVRSDVFEYREDVYAGYAQFRFTKKKWNVLTGFRYEYFNSSSTSSQLPTNTSKSFSNFFPSVHASYALNENNEINTGLSRRIERPNFRYLNPFQLGNPYFRFEGNPDLEPEFSNNLEVNYQYEKDNTSLTLSVFTRFQEDVIQRLERFTDQGVQTVTYVNGGNNTSFGIEGSLSLKPLFFMNSTFSMNYYTTFIKNEELVTFDRLFSSTWQLRNAFKVRKNLTMDLSYRHDIRRQLAFNDVKPRNRVDLAVRTKFFRDKLTLGLRVVDVLNDNLQLRDTFTDSARQEEVWDFATQSRNYLLSARFMVFENNTLSRKHKNRDYR